MTKVWNDKRGSWQEVNTPEGFGYYEAVESDRTITLCEFCKEPLSNYLTDWCNHCNKSIFDYNPHSTDTDK